MWTSVSTARWPTLGWSCERGKATVHHELFWISGSPLAWRVQLALAYPKEDPDARRASIAKHFQCLHECRRESDITSRAS
jgi:hypothetical protein